ncbi:MAG TPA: PDZ domain-containing protein [Gemmatimonadaceae bacterium]
MMGFAARTILATTSAIAAAVALPAPSLAQRRTPPPAPPGDCASCDSASRAEAERSLERAQGALERASDALAAQRDAWRAGGGGGGDGSDEARAALARAVEELQRAQESYRQALGRMMREEMAASRRDAREMALHLRMMHSRAEPKGWLGVTFSGSYTMAREDGKPVMRFSEYPVVEAVDPESPAEQAGIEARDRLVALAGRDLLEGAEPFNSLLEPGRHLPVTVRRGRQTKKLMVIVGRRPESDWPDWGVRAPLPPMAPTPPAIVTPAQPASPVGVVPAPPAMVAPMAPMPDVQVMPDGVVRVEIGGAGTSPIAGAQLQRVGELRDYFGVSDGLLVLRVVSGTPAQRAGLRGGDVILRADGHRITSPASLARVMNGSEDREVALQIVRKRSERKLVLRW